LIRMKKLGVILAAFAMLAAPALPQQAPESGATEALASVLSAACRQNDAQFADYLTAANAQAYRELPFPPRNAILKRLVLLEDPGRPLRSTDAAGHVVLRCEAPGITTEMRFGEPRVRENLAFLPVEVRIPGQPVSRAGEMSRRVEFGLVREAGAWKLLSVGLLLLDIPALARQWERADLEAREAAAVAALRRLSDAIGTFRRAFGRLPETLTVLGPAPKEGISPEAAGLVDSELAAGSKGGYAFRYRIVPGSGGAADGFELAATPTDYGKSGRISYLLDSAGILRGADKQGAVAAATDPRIEAR